MDLFISKDNNEIPTITKVIIFQIRPTVQFYRNLTWALHFFVIKFNQNLNY